MSLKEDEKQLPADKENPPSNSSDFDESRELDDRPRERSGSRSHSGSPVRGRRRYTRSRSRSYSPYVKKTYMKDKRDWPDKHAPGNYGSAGGVAGRGPKIDVLTKAPMTCRFWKNRSCTKGAAMCTYIHGYICQYDLACKKYDCQEVHIRTRKSFYGGNRSPNNHRRFGDNRYNNKQTAFNSYRREKFYDRRKSYSRSPQRSSNRDRSPSYGGYRSHSSETYEKDRRSRSKDERRRSRSRSASSRTSYEDKSKNDSSLNDSTLDASKVSYEDNHEEKKESPEDHLGAFLTTASKDRSKLKMGSLLPPTLGSASHVNMTIPQSFGALSEEKDLSKSDMWAPIMDRDDDIPMEVPGASRWDTDTADIPSPKSNSNSMMATVGKDRGQEERPNSALKSLFSNYDSKAADSTTADISKDNSNKKIRHRSESTSSSSTESSEDEQKGSSGKELVDTKQTLVNKKASLLKSMKMLMEQKRCLDIQREEIARNDASHEENSYLLEENSNLNAEITKQIHNMCSLISEIDKSIDDYEKQSDQKKSNKGKKKKKKSKKKHKKEKRHKESSSETEDRSSSKFDDSMTDKMLEEKLKEMKPQGTTVVPGGVVLAPRYWDIVKPLPNAEEQQKEENSRKDFSSDNQTSYYHLNRRSYGNDKHYGRGTGRYERYDKRNYDYGNRRTYDYEEKRGYDYDNKQNYDYDDKRNDDYRDFKSNRSLSRRRSQSPVEEISKEVKTPKKSFIPLVNVDELLNEPKKEKFKEMKQEPNLVSQMVTNELEKIKEEKVVPTVKEVPKAAFIDQGMHWCSTCITFVETLELYVKHLASPVHLSALKKKKKLLLPPVESKEKVNEAALARPLQGLEFIEAGFTYYCQLCDVLLRRAEQIQIHMHSDTHIEAYKNHNLEKPLYESSYMKDKMNAYAKFMINHQEENTQEQKPLTASNDSKVKSGSFLDEAFACDSVFGEDAEETTSDKNVVSSSSFTKDSEYAREGASQVDVDSVTPNESSQKLLAELSKTSQSIRVTARKIDKSERLVEGKGWRESSPPKQIYRERHDTRERLDSREKRSTRGDPRVRSKRAISPRRKRSPEVFENNKLIEELKKKAAQRIQEKEEAELMREKQMARNKEEEEKEAQRKLEEKLDKFSRRKSVVEEKKTHSRFPLIGKMPFFKSKPASLKSAGAKQDAESGIASPQQQQLDELQQKLQEHQLHLQQQKLSSNEAAIGESADESRHSSCTVGSREVSEDRRLTDTPEVSLTSNRVTKEAIDSDYNGSYGAVEQEASLPMDLEDSPSNTPPPPDVPPPPVDEATPPPPPLPPTVEVSSSSTPSLPPSIDIPLPTIDTPQSAPIISADIVRIREELKGGKMEGLPPYYPTSTAISSTSSSYMQHTNSAYGYHPAVAAAHTYYNNGSSGGYDMMGMYSQDYNTPPPPLFSHPPPPIPSTDEGNDGEDGDPPPPGAEDDELLPPGVEMGDVTKEAEREEVDVLMNSLLTKDQIEAKLKETGQLSP